MTKLTKRSWKDSLIIMILLLILAWSMTSCSSNRYWYDTSNGYTYYTPAWGHSKNCSWVPNQPIKTITYKRYKQWKRLN